LTAPRGVAGGAAAAAMVPRGCSTPRRICYGFLIAPAARGGAVALF
jgi:hypothetical protein